MAKRSYIQSIKTKQSSAYRGNRSDAPSIHQIDGSSQREVSSSSHSALKSWPGSPPLSAQTIEIMAEKAIKRLILGSWSKKLNPICPICRIMASRSGECGC